MTVCVKLFPNRPCICVAFLIRILFNVFPIHQVRTKKNNFLIFQPKHMLWVLKRTVSMRRFFEHPKHMLKLMGKKIFTILRSKIVFISTYVNAKETTCTDVPTTSEK